MGPREGGTERGIAAAALALSLMTTACGLLAGLEDYAPGPAEAGTSGAGHELDGGDADVPDQGDAAAPDAVGPTPFVSPFCAGAGLHLFCDSFDGTAINRASWNRAECEGCLATQDTADSISGPASFRSTTVDVAPQLVQARLLHTVNAITSSVTAEFQFKGDAIAMSPTGIVQLAAFTLVGKPGQAEPGGFELVWTAEGLFPQVCNPTCVRDPAMTLGPPPTAWTPIKMSVDFAAGIFTVAVGRVQKERMFSPEPGSIIALFTLGLQVRTAPTPPLGARYEDVTLDYN